MQMINSILNTIKHISLAKQFNCFWIRPYGECLIITKLSIKLLSYDNEKKKMKNSKIKIFISKPFLVLNYLKIWSTLFYNTGIVYNYLTRQVLL